MSHSNIALFVPQLGCPHQCSFCNQHRITGQQSRPTADDVHSAVKTALASGKCSPSETEIAFFGGSFTAVEKAYQAELLSAAAPYVERGDVSGIRISTRPDCITPEILSFLKEHKVTAIELGAQSMDDDVLRQNHRGHTAQQVASSAALIRKNGFSLGLQMMTGLFASTPDIDRQTALRLAQLQPDTMRIYPTIVLEDTPLCDLYRNGAYAPMALEEAVSLCSELLTLFSQRNIRVIRLGLHSSEELAHAVAGPYHPAFAELCYSHCFLQKLTAYLQREHIPPGKWAIGVSPRCLSKAIGQGKRNQTALLALGYDCAFFGDPDLSQEEFRLEKR
ncbi:MAG: radical SAM protein [Oscillospiraceae bacterium]|nr:radical SAM protein [Oscillospiraceae bacterium]